jgi:hypothetical protein
MRIELWTHDGRTLSLLGTLAKVLVIMSRIFVRNIIRFTPCQWHQKRKVDVFQADAFRKRHDSSM